MALFTIANPSEQRGARWLALCSLLRMRKFLVIAVLTGVLNILYLTGAVFMLEVYDRVLPSRSMPTSPAPTSPAPTWPTSWN